MPQPNSQNTLVISLGWVVTGAVVTTTSLIILARLGWSASENLLVRETVIYLPVLCLNVLAHIGSVFRQKSDNQDKKHRYLEIYISSMMGAVVGALVRSFGAMF